MEVLKMTGWILPDGTITTSEEEMKDYDNSDYR